MSQLAYTTIESDEDVVITLPASAVEHILNMLNSAQSSSNSPLQTNDFSAATAGRSDTFPCSKRGQDDHVSFKLIEDRPSFGMA